MFGDINVRFRLDGKKYNLELGYNSTPQDFFERFLRLTSIDPDLYIFMSEKNNILNSGTLIQAVSNPLSDFKLDCTPKKKVAKTPTIFTFKLSNGKTQSIQIDLNMSSEDHVKSVIASYFKLDPRNFNLKKISQNKYSISKELFSFNANINGTKHQIIYSENATVLDIKYYASFASGYSCSQFFIGETEYRNSLLFSSISNLEGDKIFKKFIYQIYFRLEEKNQVQTATLEGSAIGRNVKRAIANATNQSVSGMLEDYLAIDNDGTHIPVDTFTKFNIFSITESTPFVFGIPLNVTLKIKIGNEKAQSIKKSFDPDVTVEQLRRQIAKLYRIDSPSFVAITGSNEKSPDDEDKLGNFASNESILKITINTPKEVEACFTLYNNQKFFKQIKVGVDETNSSVLKHVAKSFNVNPDSVCLWLNNIQLVDSDRFLKNYFSKATFNLSGKLKVEVDYLGIISTFMLPFTVQFEDLSSICSYKYGKPKESIAFYVKSSNSLKPVHQPWNGKLIPGKQYISRYRSSSEKDLVKLILKLKSEEVVSESKIPVNVSIFKNGSYAKETFEASQTDRLSKIFEPKLFKDYPRGIDINSLIFINGQICRSSMTIGEAIAIQKDLIIYVYPPGTFMYNLPKEKEVKYIVTEEYETIEHLMKTIYKSDTNFSLMHNGQVITDTHQLVQFFDPEIPFKVVFDEETSYTLTFTKEGEEDDVYTSKIPVTKETTVYNLLSSSCDFVKQKSNIKTIKPTQIRVTINSVLLTKEMEDIKLIEKFGPSCNVDIILLQKFCFTIQGENLLTFHFSRNDTIHFAKLTVLRRLKAQEEDLEYYYLLKDGIGVSDDEHLSDYIEDEDLIFDIVPVQNTVKPNFVFPEFTRDFVFSNSIIMYDVKEYFAKFYDIDDPDKIELIDTETNEAIDENDNPVNGKVIKVCFKDEKRKLNKKFSKLFKKPKIHSRESKIKMMSVKMNDSGFTFSCPFRNQDDSSDFNLKVSNDITCSQAKILIIEHLNSSGKNEEKILEPENILISLNNEKMADAELLKPKYLAEAEKHQGTRFIVEINRILDAIV